MAISITPSPFGSITVTLDGELGGVLQASILATSNSALNMDLGVPGPAGSQGPAGRNGQGVAAGGLVNQVLVKLSNDDFDTGWANGGAGGDYLPLAGGSMSGDIIWPAVGTGSDSLIGTFGFGTENTTLGQTAYVEPQQIRIYDTTNTNGTSLNSSGISFNDETTQTTAALPLTGGTVNGNVTFNNIDGSHSLYSDADGFHFTGTSQIWTDGDRIYFSASGNNVLKLSSGEIQFADNTIQTTAFLGYSGTTSQYIRGDGSLATFPDLSGYATQSWVTSQGYITSSALTPYLTITSAASTYFPKPTGTTSQYIDGTGALQTFPTVTSVGKMTLTAYNQTGSTIPQGAVVYITGSHGNDPQVTLAIADTEAHSAFSIGIAQSSVANNTNGTFVTAGTLESFDTHAWSDGTPLYLSPTVAGGLTSTKPLAPNHYTKIGTVIRSHPTQGTFFVKIENGFQLDEMSDVSIPSLTNNDVLTYESSSALWKNKSIATILGYTPANETNYLAKADNLSGLASTSTARTNLGLGTASTLASTAVAQTANNLSDLASASTARTNLGLGTAATQSTSTFLQTANKLSDVTASTARTNLGLGAVSTDAYATTTQAQAGTSTTSVINPSTLLDAKYFQGGKSAVQFTWSTSVSGTGASASAQNANARLNAGPTSATGYAISSAVIANNSRGTIFNSGYDFSKRVSFGLRVARNVASPDTNSVFRYSIGKSSGTDASDLSARGLMIKVAGTGALQLLVHNGTTLTTTTSSYTPSNGVSYDVSVVSDGSGNVTLYVNGSSVATSTGGPTSAGATNANYLIFEIQNTAILSASAMNIAISDYYVQVNS